MKNEGITRQIIGCAFRVYNQMGFGFLESVYENCMLIELNKEKLRATAQTPIKVFYEGEIVGQFVADLLVDNKVIVELKSVRQINTAHETQLVNYLVATNLDVGLLLNFGEQNVEIKRKLRTLNKYN